MNRVSIKDVAKAANVSTATVSHVINKTKFVSPEINKRVNESIKNLNYRQNIAAKNFKLGKKKLIAFIVPDIANYYFSTLIEEIETTLGLKGYKLIIVNTKEIKERELENIKLLASGIVDGFIIASTIEDYDDYKNYIPSDMPCVFIDREIKNCKHDIAKINSYDAMVEGVSYLINKGNKKIGYITGIPRLSTSRERLVAYINTMTTNNLFDEKLIKIGDSMSQSVEKNLELLLEMDCTAIIAANNVMATEAMDQLSLKGYKIGKDIELLGYKDSSLSQIKRENANLIFQPSDSLGQIGAKLLLEKLENPNLPQRREILKAEFKIQLK